MAKLRSDDLLGLLRSGKPVMLAEYRGHKIVTGTRHVTQGENQGRALEFHRVEHAIECELNGEVAVHTVTSYIPDGQTVESYVPPAARGEQVAVTVTKYGKVGNKGSFAFAGDFAVFGGESSSARAATPQA